MTQQRIDYEAMVRQFSYPHPPGIRTRDAAVAGRHGDIPLRDDARLYVERLQNAGGAARWINESGLVLDYLRAPRLSSRQRRLHAHLRRNQRTRQLNPRGQTMVSAGMNITTTKN